MIEFTKAYVSGGSVYATLREAQRAELMEVLCSISTSTLTASGEIANYILDNQQRVMDILTTTDTSRPKARAVHGGKKNRKKGGQPELQIPVGVEPIVYTRGELAPVDARDEHDRTL